MVSKMEDVFKFKEFSKYENDILHSFIYYDNSLYLLILEIHRKDWGMYNMWVFTFGNNIEKKYSLTDEINNEIYKYAKEYLLEKYVENEEKIKFFNGFPVKKLKD